MTDLPGHYKTGPCEQGDIVPIRVVTNQYGDIDIHPCVQCWAAFAYFVQHEEWRQVDFTFEIDDAPLHKRISDAVAARVAEEDQPTTNQEE